MSYSELSEHTRALIDRKLADYTLMVPAPVFALGGVRRQDSTCSGCDGQIEDGDAELRLLAGDGSAHLFHARCGHYTACQLAGYSYGADGRELLH